MKVLFLILCVGAQALLARQLLIWDTPWVPPPSSLEAFQQKKNPLFYRIISFGHLPSVANALWIRAFLEQDLVHVPQGFHPQSFFDLMLLVELDPENFSAYVDGASYLSIVRSDSIGAEQLLQKGQNFRKNILPAYSKQFQEEHWSSQWAIPFYLAYLNLFEFNQVSQAALYYKETAQIPGVPPLIQRYGGFFETTKDQYKSGLRILNYLIRISVDPTVKRKLKKKRQSLFVGLYLYDLNASFRNFLRQEKTYRKRAVIERKFLQKLWKKFARISHIPKTDPWGGKLYLSESGEILSTTPQEFDLGMEY